MKRTDEETVEQFWLKTGIWRFRVLNLNEVQNALRMEIRKMERAYKTLSKLNRQLVADNHNGSNLGAPKPRKAMSAYARRKISLAMKRRWAAKHAAKPIKQRA